MSKLLKDLKDWGCDVENAMERMAEDEDFYAECLHDISVDPSFSELEKALSAGDIPAAFNAAHTLKGVLANLGLTPMYNKAVEIVEPLRAGKKRGLAKRYSELMKLKERLDSILKDI